MRRRRGPAEADERSIKLGTFGYCIGGSGGDCTGTSLGYDLSFITTVLTNLGVDLGSNTNLDTITGISTSLLRSPSTDLLARD